MTAPGHPRAGVLIRDAARSALARRAATLTTSLVVAVVCLVVLATTGRTAATEAQVLASVDSLGTRLITVTDTTGTSGIDFSAVAALERLDGVRWAFGLGPASDTLNPAIGAVSGVAVAARPLVGTLPAELLITAGRDPSPGQAVAGAAAARALGLADVAAPLAIGGTAIGVVGEFSGAGPLAGLGDAVLVATDDPGTTVRYIYVLADDAADVTALAAAVEAAVPASIPSAVEVEISDGALALREVLTGALGASSRQLMAIVLATGMALVTITTTGAVAARRRDFGRQRALGATRTAIVASVLVQSAVAGLLGTLAGLGLGLPLTYQLTGALPTTRFTAGLAGLTLVVSLAGSVAPALAAALRDPVRILRVP